MKSISGSFYTVLGFDLLIQFFGVLTAMLVTDMGRTMGFWLLGCLAHWVCFSVIVITNRKRPFKETGTVAFQAGLICLFCVFFLLFALLGH